MDSTLAKNLQLKSGQRLRALHAPQGFEADVPEAGGRGTGSAGKPAGEGATVAPAAFMTARGVRPVRQVAIDDVWSALRFRPAVW
jgi:hypothetical protein